MGVKGLLPVLRSITRPVTLERYRGLTVAVDAMSWLHKGVFAGDVRSLAKHQWEERLRNNSSSEGSDREQRDEGKDDGGGGDGPAKRKIDFDAYVEADRSRSRQGGGGRSSENSARSREIARAAAAASSKCVAYAMRNAEALRGRYGMEVVLVIDGGSLPSKSGIDKGRRDERLKAYRAALAAEAKGDSRNARKLFARACSVTHEMRRDLVAACRSASGGGGLSFVVAPYEADGQLAQLAHSGAVDLIVTEDSDLLAYGCPRVLFKADVAEGKGEEVQLMRDLASNDEPSFRNWTHDMFVYMCIVNGCDYCEGVPGVGIKTAHKLVRMHRTPTKIFNALRAAGRMPDGFEDSFWRAYRTFRHQRVYNQEKECVEPLLPIDETRLDASEDVKTAWPYLGPWIDPETAQALATGVLHPAKKVPWEALAAIESRNETDSRGSTDRHASRRPESRMHRDENDEPSSASGRRPDSAKLRKDMFRFFPAKKKKSAADESSPSSRPPLKEIVLDLDGSKDGSGLHDSKLANNYGVAPPVPIHFNEYSSKLVGRTFETLSRRGRGSTGGRDVSRAVQRLRDNARARVKSKLGTGEDSKGGGKGEASGGKGDVGSKQGIEDGSMKIQQVDEEKAVVSERPTTHASGDPERPTTHASGDPAKSTSTNSAPSGNEQPTVDEQGTAAPSGNEQPTVDEQGTVDGAQRKGLNLHSISSFGVPAHQSKSPAADETPTDQAFVGTFVGVDVGQKEGNCETALELTELRPEGAELRDQASDARSSICPPHVNAHHCVEETGSHSHVNARHSVEETDSHQVTKIRPHSANYEQIFSRPAGSKRERPYSSPPGVTHTCQRINGQFNESMIRPDYHLGIKDWDQYELCEDRCDRHADSHSHTRVDMPHPDLSVGGVAPSCLETYEKAGTDLTVMDTSIRLDTGTSFLAVERVDNYSARHRDVETGSRFLDSRQACTSSNHGYTDYSQDAKSGDQYGHSETDFLGLRQACARSDHGYTQFQQQDLKSDAHYDNEPSSSRFDTAQYPGAETIGPRLASTSSCYDCTDYSQCQERDSKFGDQESSSSRVHSARYRGAETGFLESRNDHGYSQFQEQDSKSGAHYDQEPSSSRLHTDQYSGAETGFLDSRNDHDYSQFQVQDSKSGAHYDQEPSSSRLHTDEYSGAETGFLDSRSNQDYSQVQLRDSSSDGHYDKEPSSSHSRHSAQYPSAETDFLDSRQACARSNDHDYSEFQQQDSKSPAYQESSYYNGEAGIIRSEENGASMVDDQGLQQGYIEAGASNDISPRDVTNFFPSGCHNQCTEGQEKRHSRDVAADTVGEDTQFWDTSVPLTERCDFLPDANPGNSQSLSGTDEYHELPISF